MEGGGGGTGAVGLGQATPDQGEHRQDVGGGGEQEDGWCPGGSCPGVSPITAPLAAGANLHCSMGRCHKYQEAAHLQHKPVFTGPCPAGLCSRETGGGLAERDTTHPETGRNGHQCSLLGKVQD